MPTPHSTVMYVEPNVEVGYGDDKWRVSDDFNRAPRLEDYCIAMNIEVEVCTRDRVKGDSSSGSEVLILQYSDSSGKTFVNFLGGTKIGGYNISNTTREAVIGNAPDALTTYYADMYAGDLTNYGTTEMVGIKSVNIELVQNCVPRIDIVFTDVRGLSIFQPTQGSRTYIYESIRDLNPDNVAQSFFQCFFRMPLPKFTIYVKGFYGKPVAYEVMCDKFETSFNSETGDFDVNTSFIGYSYSFMTDISMEALMAAPLSPYKGAAYWKSQVEGGHFFLLDRLGQKTPMPTLYEAVASYRKAVDDTRSITDNTTLSEEELTHVDEIEKLSEIRDTYETWYKRLYDVVCAIYGKDRCFEFKEDGKAGDYYRILVLTDKGKDELRETGNPVVSDMRQEYTQFPDGFKKLNMDLYSYIEKMKADPSVSVELKNTTTDFSGFKLISLFNECYRENDGSITFGGFADKGPLYENTGVVRRLFNASETEDGEGTPTVTNEQVKQKTLKTIYNGGNQLTNAFMIQLEYAHIKRRINALNEDSKRNDIDKANEKRRKELNDKLLAAMTWYPSVENFSRIMMAHLETFMHIMYSVSSEVQDRTPESLGVGLGEDGNVCDVSDNSKTVPPFPRVIKKTTGDDNITRTEDTWVGEFTNGSGFLEEQVVNSFFEAMDILMQQFAADTNEPENTEDGSGMDAGESSRSFAVKLPLTPYDFFIDKSPYDGIDGDTLNDIEGLIGIIAVRMFDILSLGGFADKLGWKNNVKFIQNVATVEAVNFHRSVNARNTNFKRNLNSGCYDVEKIPGLLSDSANNRISNPDQNSPSQEVPWKLRDKNGDLFDGNDFWLTKYGTGDHKFMYPIHSISFGAMDDLLSSFKNNSTSIAIEDSVNVNSIDSRAVAERVVNAVENGSCFNNVFITDDFKRISDAFEKASSMDEYSVYESLWGENNPITGPSGAELDGMVLTNSVFNDKAGLACGKSKYYLKGSMWLGGNYSGAMKVATNGKNTIENEAASTEGNEFVYSEKPSDYSSEAMESSIHGSFISEIRGYSVEKKGDGTVRRYVPNPGKSLFADGQYSMVPSGREAEFFLMGADCVDYSALSKVMTDKNRMVAYVPKIAVLQIGAVLTAAGRLTDGKGKVTANMVEDKFPLTESFRSHGFKIINSMSASARIGFVKYYVEWKEKSGNLDFLNSFVIRKANGSNPWPSNPMYSVFYFSEKDSFHDKNTDKDYPKVARCLFNENNDKVSKLTNDLMHIVLVAKGTINYSYGETRSAHTIGGRDNIKAYFEAFFAELKVLNGLASELETDDSGKIVYTKPTTKVTDDMKKELYRYLKQLYDKWIPTTPKSAWNYLTFFNEEEDRKIMREDGGGGHMFHFIDSYYNKIGSRLLINPERLYEAVVQLLTANDVNTMMLGFMADVYARNKCMLICLQNFMDLSKEENMTRMFEPLPYNDMGRPNKHPDFVVIYPYEPSKNLNVENGEFKDDSFMLNDETKTPLAITSRDGNSATGYKIPAFGVTYGRQYQSYFKKVNVNMSSPIATQQSIIAKHAILRNAGNTNVKGVVAQDLYDIYSTQSYTCTVEMLGCPWVQPLMYFVLTNIPMFNGSYMIFKIKHSITPGNMTTEFTGCRMCNVSNKMVEDIFTDDMFDSTANNYLEGKRNEAANVDNDCPYKVYPLWESDAVGGIWEGDEKGPKFSTPQAWATAIFHAWLSRGVNPEIAKVIVAQEGLECGWGSLQCAPFNYGGFKPGGKCKSFSSVGEFVDYGIKHVYCNYPGALQAKTWREYFDIIQNINGANPKKRMYCVDQTVKGKFYPCTGDKYTKAIMNGGYYQKACEYLKDVSITPTKSSKTDNASDKEKMNVSDALFNAVQKSCLSTPSINVELVKGYNKSNTHMTIRQKNGGNDKLKNVFDVILNGYYEYVSELYWVYSGALTAEPSMIVVKASQSNNDGNRKVGVVGYGKQFAAEMNNRFGNAPASGFNKSMLTSIYKRYNGNLKSKEIPQFNDSNIFNDMSVANCDDIIGVGGGGQLEGFAGNVKNEKMRKVLSRVNEICVNHRYGDKNSWYTVRGANGNRKPCPTSKCTFGPSTWYNEAGREYDLHFYPGPKVANHNNTTLGNYGMKMVWHGTIAEAKAKPKSEFRPGDVCTQYYYTTKHEPSAHGCMWTGKDWRSDFIQSGIMANSKFTDRDGNYSVCIWRHPDFQEPGLSLT